MSGFGNPEYLSALYFASSTSAGAPVATGYHTKSGRSATVRLSSRNHLAS